MKTVVFSAADAASRRCRALWNALRPASGRGAGVFSFFVAIFISFPNEAPPKTFAFEDDGWRVVATDDAETDAPLYAPDENAEENENVDYSNADEEYVEATTDDAYADALAPIAETDDAETGPFHRLRSLRRARTNRLFGGRFADEEAPEPPEVEPVEHVERVEAPKLTPVNDNLPALDMDGRLDSNGTFVTREELDALREEMSLTTWKKGDFRITPYGFLNLSMSADTQRAVPGEYMLYAQTPEVDDSSDFTVDARTSRIGFKMEGPRVEQLNADLRGCLEFDFQGAINGSKNKGGVQLRRAYAELVDAENQRRFLAGQDWEIISPLCPQMLNYLPGGFAGSLQYRRAQIRFEQGYTLSPDFQTLAQFAVCDNILGDYTSTPGVSAATSGWPVLEGRVAVSLFKDARNGRPITLGVSGHIGEQYYKFSPIAGTFANTSERVAVDTWSANFDADVPLTEKFRLQGEYTVGANLSSFCGGINQGVDLYRRDALGASGGWLALHTDWTQKFATNVGYGVEKMDDDDLVGTSVAANGFTTSRTRNELYFVNFLYNWTPNFMTGVEFGYWQTQYQKADVTGETPVFTAMKPGEAFRTEFTARLTF